MGKKRGDKMKCDELKAFTSERIYWAVEQVERKAGDIADLHLDDNLFYIKSEADKVIAEKDKEIYNITYSRDEWAKTCNQKDKEIAELKAKLENVQASAYAESVDAGMRERRLRRALYKACANWALSTFAWLDCIDQGEPRKWSEMVQKCRAKAEEYK